MYNSDIFINNAYTPWSFDSVFVGNMKASSRGYFSSFVERSCPDSKHSVFLLTLDYHHIHQSTLCVTQTKSLIRSPSSNLMQ